VAILQKLVAEEGHALVVARAAGGTFVKQWEGIGALIGRKMDMERKYIARLEGGWHPRGFWKGGGGGVERGWGGGGLPRVAWKGWLAQRGPARGGDWFRCPTGPAQEAFSRAVGVLLYAVLGLIFTEWLRGAAPSVVGWCTPPPLTTRHIPPSTSYILLTAFL
jgi:hypothetical protein